MTQYFMDGDFEDRLLDASESRRSKIETQSSNITPEMVQRVIDMEQAYGSSGMSPGVMEALAKEGFSAEDMQSYLVAQMEAEQDSEEGDGGLWGTLKRSGRATARGAFVVAESLWEEGLARPFRTLGGAAAMAQEEVYGEQFRFGETGDERGAGINTEEWGAFFRNLDDAYRQSGESSGVRVVRKWWNDDPVELGTGIIPRGLFSESREVAETGLQYLGEPISPGRFVAGGLYMEPGSTAYNIASGTLDFAAQIYADPAFRALKAGSRLAEFRRTFGAVEAHRKSVDVQRHVDNFLTKTKAGNNLAEDIADTDSFYEIWRMLGKGHGAKEHAARLRGINDPGAVKNYLADDVLGQSVRTRPDNPRGFKARMKRSLDDLESFPVFKRLFHDIPKQRLNVEDLDDAVQQLDKYMINAGMGNDVRARHLDKLADVQEGDTLAVWDVVRGMADDIDAHLGTKWGKKSNVTRKLTRVFDDDIKDARRYYTEHVSGELHNAYAPGQKVTMVDGIPTVDPSPHLLTEYLHRSIPLPNFREIRRAASHIGPMLDIPGVSRLEKYLTSGMSKLWKPVQLMRIAWTTRVVGEEQVRIAGAGLDSAFSNPLSWVAYAIGRKGQRNVLGQVWDDLDEFQSAMSRGSAGWRGSNFDAVTGGQWIRYRKGDEMFLEAAGEELRQVANTSLGRAVAAAGDDIDSVKASFWDGDLAAHRKRLTMGASDEKRVLVDDDVARREGERLARLGVIDEPWQGAREASDEFVDSVMRRIQEKTGGNPDLIDAIATRKLNGKSLRPGNGSIADELANYEDALPAAVKGPRALREGDNISDWDSFVERAFHVLMSRPTNQLSRSPAFRQFYWRRVAELGPWMDDKVRAQMMAAARKNNLDDVAERLGKAKSRARTNLNAEQIDDLAKAHGLDETRNLLYSLDKRGQWADIGRNIFPFGEAWKEVLGTWTRLATRRPQNIRRAQQGILGARGSGLFYKDENGEERFNYPAFGFLGAIGGAGAGALTGGLTAGPIGALAGGVAGALGGGALGTQAAEVGEGVMTQAGGRAQGLNLVATGLLPGFGPVVQWPAAQFLSDAPKFDWVRKAILPFGSEQSEAGTIGELIDNNLPAWSRDFINGLSNGRLNQRMFQNTIGEIAKAKMLSGEFERDQVQENLEESAKQARYMYLVKGLARFVLPTGPNVDFKAQDQNGTWARTQVFAQVYREMVDELEGNTERATAIFEEKFGLDPLLLSAPSTKKVRERSFTPSGYRWERENPDLVKAHRDVIGFFAPDHKDRDFDHEAYLNAIEAGDQETLTAEQQLLYYNNTLGWAQYNKVKDILETKYGANNEKLNTWLRTYKSKLKEEYPGYDSISSYVPTGLDVADTIEKLQEASQNEKLAATDAGQGLRKYLNMRGVMLAKADGADLSGQKDIKKRAVLLAYGERLKEEHPEFIDMWQRVLSREVED